MSGTFLGIFFQNRNCQIGYGGANRRPKGILHPLRIFYVLYTLCVCQKKNRIWRKYSLDGMRLWKDIVWWYKIIGTTQKNICVFFFQSRQKYWDVSLFVALYDSLIKEKKHTRFLKKFFLCTNKTPKKNLFFLNFWKFR